MLSIVPVFIGLCLGLLGGGGSILAVPALTYIYGLDAKAAIAVSLVTVGFSSLIISLKTLWKKEIELKQIISFTLFSSAAAFLSAKFLAVLLSSETQLIIFSFLVLIVAIKMLSAEKPKHDETKISSLQTYTLGAGIGAITGLVGVGGGFLIVPALHYGLKLPMKESIKSSLIVIAIQSLSGFGGYLSNSSLDINLIAEFMTLVLAGTFLGIKLREKSNEKLLKKLFAFLLLSVSAYMFFKLL